MNRREFLAALTSCLTTPYSVIASPLAPSNSSAANADLVFPLSISSGDPSENGAVIWTKLEPSSIQEGKDLYFQVSSSKDFKDTLIVGAVTHNKISSANDYTVKVNLKDNGSYKLKSNTHYYYRFIYNDTHSNTGRLKTLASDKEEPKSLKLAVLTCQDYSSGFFTAYEHLAQEDVDFVVHLGDFVYEYDSYPSNHEHLRKVGLKHKVATCLEDYRKIHHTYRQDKHLQKALEHHTFIYSWDDHETANDHSYDPVEDSYRLVHGHPLQEASSEARRQLVFEARKAWLEYTPMSAEISDSTHPHEFFKIYRQYKFSNLLNLHTSDSRTYRVSGETEAESNMLGQQQQQWLEDKIVSSKTHWRVWANQTFFSELAIRGPISRNPYSYINTDAWDGFRTNKECLSVL